MTPLVAAIALVAFRERAAENEVRFTHASYDIAKQCAQEMGLKLPMA